MTTSSVAEFQQTAYTLMGGEAAVRHLVNRFYDIMDQCPETQALRAMHPQDLSGSKQKLYMFLSGWLGGPPLFIEAFGHPRLRARHLPFAIDKAMRDAWMMCMRQAMEEQVLEENVKRVLLKALWDLADFMRNVDE